MTLTKLAALAPPFGPGGPATPAPARYFYLEPLAAERRTPADAPTFAPLAAQARPPS